MAEENDSHSKEAIVQDSPSSSSKEEIPASKVELRGYTLSAHIKRYPKEELKLFARNSFIGSGGFGSVRKYQLKDKIVAVKEFTVGGDDEAITKACIMVQREANILCCFHHENIVEILGITQWSNIIGIIMEYIDGGNLQDLLFKRVRYVLSWNTRLEIARGITSGLGYLHNYGEKQTFCHGDLKPANVLLTQSLQVKLADFGSAAICHATGSSTTTATQSSAMQFTLLYVAPEFLQNNTQKKKPASDMYSFGMMMYELISRKIPYSDAGLPILIPALIMAKVKPSQKLIDNVGNQLKSNDDRAAFNLLKRIMEKCLNNDPSLRPSSNTVEMELKSYMINQRQGFSSGIHGLQRLGAEATAIERANAAAPALRKLTKQDFKSFAPSSSARQFRNDPPSTSYDTTSPKQASSGEARAKDLVQSLREMQENLQRLLQVLGVELQCVEHDVSAMTEEQQTLLKRRSCASTLIENHQSVQDILEKYTDCLLKKDYEEADVSRATLRSLVVDEVKAEAENVMLFAQKLHKEEKYLQSVVAFDTAAALFAELKNPENDMERILYCIQGIKIAIDKMVHGDESTKVIVREHLLPLMRDWLRKLKTTTVVSEKWKCHIVTWTLSNIEMCELWVEQWEERKQTLEEAVDGMRRVFGTEVHKVHGRLFGTLLNNLGVAYKRESRLEEAVGLFKESVEAHKAAVDYFGDEENRSRDISISDQNLKSSMRQAWEKHLQQK